ncbi:SpaA isopeptide-forming pilin-related protein [Nocardioides cheoyonin]|uniref:DUF7927 domain-containing protein n=1 Tax=Nocardioides cheoyonin TaxID=3156615 RepID=UPI0032B5AE12
MRSLVGAAICFFLVLAFLVFVDGETRPDPASAAVPTPTGNNAVITVKVGGDRSSVNAVAGLEGVVLGLFANAGDTEPVNQTWALCTSDADGDCSFTVPNTQMNAAGTACAAAAVNCDRRFYIKQISVPDGWYSNPSLRTGDTQGSTGSSESTAYQFRTGTQLRAGTTYRSTVDFMIGSGNTTRNASGGVWQQSRVNPELPDKCGLNVAVIMDFSLSVQQSGDVQNLKNAANSVADALTGTPSRMALFSFGYVSPSSYNQPNNPDLIPVSTQAGADAFKAQYAGWGATGATNWDNALYTASLSAGVAGTTNHYDLAIVITDGNPTVYGNRGTQGPNNVNGNNPVAAEGPTNFDRLREDENAIFSANALKAQGTRVIAVGVGNGITQTAAQTALNLRAISGQDAYDPSNPNPDAADYFMLSDYTVAARVLRNLVYTKCSPSVTVVKAIVPYDAADGDYSDAYPAGEGWQFTASASGDASVVGDTTKTTGDDGTGAVNFPMSFDPVDGSGNISIQENQQGGYTRVGQSCTELTATNTSGTTVPVTPSGDDSGAGATPGFSFDMDGATQVNCIIYNKPATRQADLTVTKSWTINGVNYPQGTQPSEIGAGLVMNGPQTDSTPSQGWGVPRYGYDYGSTTQIAEGMFFGSLPNCTLTSANVTSITRQDNGGTAVTTPSTDTFPAVTGRLPEGDEISYDVPLTADHTTVAVHNTVTCTSTLTLRKQVEGGSADNSSWTLSAIGATDSLPGPTGVDGSSTATDVQVTPGANYQLREDTAPGVDPSVTAPYIQKDERTNLQSNPQSTGSMYCHTLDADGNVTSSTVDGLNGGVAVLVGERMECVAINQSATLELRKVVQGGSADPSDFTLTATPQGSDLPAGLGPVSVEGNDAANGTAVDIRPGVEYTISESGPSGYEHSAPVCESVTRQRTSTVGPLDPLDTELCTFTNILNPGHLTLVKQVTNDNGGTAVATDWTLNADGPTPVSGPSGDPLVTNVDVEAGDYDLSETDGPGGYAAGDWDCGDAEQTGSTVTVEAGEDVTCTIVNDDQPGSVSWRKTSAATGVLLPGSEWTITGPGEAEITVADCEADPCTGPDTDPVPGQFLVTDLDWGSYTLTETTAPDGYEISADPVQFAIDGGSDPLDLGAIDNDEQPAWTLTKSSDPASGSTVDAGSDITYTLTVTDTGTVPLTDAIVQDDLTDVLPYADLHTPLASGLSRDRDNPNLLIWTVPEVPAGESVSVSYTVGLHDDAWGITVDNAATPQSPGGVCVAENDCVTTHHTPAKVTVAKSDASVTQLADFTWQVDYRVTVRNASAVASTTYTLTDHPSFDSSFSIVSEGWLTEPGTDVDIAPNGEDIYTYRVIARANANVSESAFRCDPAPDGGGGFFNQADVAFPGGTDSDTGCGVPATPEVDKTAAAPVERADGTWMVSYQVTVSNPSKLQLAYRLHDTPGDLPAGVRLTSGWSVSGPTKSPARAGDATLNDGWNGGSETEVATGTLPAGASHTYTVTAAVRIAHGTRTAALTCSDGSSSSGGIPNSATVGNGVGQDTDSACASLTGATWTVVKSSNPASGSSVQPGTVITYTVTASLLSGTTASGLTIVDDLSDVLDDASLVAGSVTASTGEHTVSGTRLTWRIAALTGKETLTYQVRVDADASGVRLDNVVTADGAEPCGVTRSAVSRSAARQALAPSLSVRPVAARDLSCRETQHTVPTASSTPIGPTSNTGGPTLPDTGGPSLWWAVGGMASLLAGLGLVLTGRRRRYR